MLVRRYVLLSHIGMQMRYYDEFYTMTCRMAAVRDPAQPPLLVDDSCSY